MLRTQAMQVMLKAWTIIHSSNKTVQGLWFPTRKDPTAAKTTKRPSSIFWQRTWFQRIHHYTNVSHFNRGGKLSSWTTEPYGAFWKIENPMSRDCVFPRILHWPNGICAKSSAYVWTRITASMLKATETQQGSQSGFSLSAHRLHIAINGCWYDWRRKLISLPL